MATNYNKKEEKKGEPPVRTLREKAFQINEWEKDGKKTYSLVKSWNEEKDKNKPAKWKNSTIYFFEDGLTSIRILLDFIQKGQ